MESGDTINPPSTTVNVDSAGTIDLSTSRAKPRRLLCKQQLKTLLEKLWRQIQNRQVRAKQRFEQWLGGLAQGFEDWLDNVADVITTCMQETAKRALERFLQKIQRTPQEYLDIPRWLLIQFSSDRKSRLHRLRTALQEHDTRKLYVLINHWGAHKTRQLLYILSLKDRTLLSLSKRALERYVVGPGEELQKKEPPLRSLIKRAVKRRVFGPKKRPEEARLVPSRQEGNEQIECEICLDEHLKTDFVTLPCKHSFCNKCLQHWLKAAKNRTCPYCRFRLTYRLCGHKLDHKACVPGSVFYKRDFTLNDGGLGLCLQCFVGVMRHKCGHCPSGHISNEELKDVCLECRLRNCKHGKI